MADLSTHFSREVRPRSAKQVEKDWPRFRELWAHIRDVTGTKQGYPKLVTLTTEPARVVAHDHESCYRFVVRLSDNRVLASAFVSTGDCALMNHFSGVDLAVDAVPVGFAMVTYTFSDYYRSSHLRAQVDRRSVASTSP